MSIKKLSNVKLSAGTPHQPPVRSAAEIDEDSNIQDLSDARNDDVGVARSAEQNEVSGDLHTEVLQALSEVESELVAARLEVSLLTSQNERLANQLLELGTRNTESENLRLHDELTGMANRQLLESRVQQAIVEASTRQSQLAILMIGLDDFETIADRLGGVGGDHLLMAVASRIAAAVRLEDLSCRYDEEQFVVLLTNVGASERAQTIMEKIRERISRRYCIGGLDVQPTASIGLSFYPSNGGHCSALLKRASAARKLDQSSRKGSSAQAVSNH